MATQHRTWLNHREEGPELEINTEPSQTQPDEVLSIREMLDRHVRGLPVEGGQEGVYYPEEMGYIPDLRTLDLTEMEDYQNHYKTQSERIQKELEERQARDKAEADEEEKLQLEIKKQYIKQKSEQKTTTSDKESPS